MKKFKSLREKFNVDEAFGMFVVPIPKQTLNGKKIGGESITVKARTAREAIQKAAKELGVDFKFLKTGKVTKESFNEGYTSLLTVEINEGLSPALKKAEKLMGPSKTKDQGIEFVMKGMKVDKKKATQMVDQILKMKESSVVTEANMADVKKQLGKVKGLSKDAYNQLITLPMPVLTTMVNQLSGIVSNYDMKENVELNENKRFNFQDGDIANSDLYMITNELITIQDKTAAQLKKFSDPVLIKSVNDLLSKIQKTVNVSLKAQSQTSKIISRAATDINKTFDLIRKKQYLINSTEVEGDQQLDEAFNIEKGALVKMKGGDGKDLYGKVIKQIKVNGKPGVTVQWKSGVKGNFRMDQFAAVSMDRKADYQVQDDGVRF
jgi:hypothetical protein